MCTVRQPLGSPQTLTCSARALVLANVTSVVQRCLELEPRQPRFHQLPLGLTGFRGIH
jgi:hypothetical protein